MRSRTIVALLAFTGAQSLAAQPAETYGFVSRLGIDTVALERVTRTATRLEGDVVDRVPRVVRRHYVADLNPDGTVRRFEVTIRPAHPVPPAPAEQRITVEFGGDSLTVTIRSDSTVVRRVAASGLIMPWMLYGPGTYEQMFMVARRRGNDSVAVAAYSPGSRGVTPTFVRAAGNDSVALAFFGDLIMARVDQSGRLLGLNGARTTIKVLIERVRDVDVPAIAARFAAAEPAMPTATAMSPRDTARGTYGSADLLVDYGRPAKRGRLIFGGIVPWDQVWRTGANAATQFSTSRDLEFAGGVVVPAGKYTLWSLPTPAGTQLIVNQQTGQWGTQHDGKQDLVRLPLAVEKTAAPVEVFTIRIEESAGGGRIVMDWDTTRWVAAFKVK